MHQTDTNRISSSKSIATETYIGHPYLPAMYQPAALHEEGAERSQRVASPSCTVPCLLVTATVHFFPPFTLRYQAWAYQHLASAS